MLQLKIITYGWSGLDTILSFTHPALFIPKRVVLLSPNRRLLKNEILYCFSSGSVTIHTIPNLSFYA